MTQAFTEEILLHWKDIEIICTRTINGTDHWSLYNNNMFISIYFRLTVLMFLYDVHSYYIVI